MRYHQQNVTNNRRGAIVALAVIFVVIAIAFLAFAVDWGHLVVTSSELQNAADAGALSGARALPAGRSAAVNAAQSWSAKNFATGKPVATVADEDIEIGLWDAASASFVVLAENSSESPNAVRVTCRRTVARGNPVKLFFAAALGTKFSEMSASAIAAINRDRCGLIVGIDWVDVKNGQIDSYDSEIGAYHNQPPRANGHVCSDGPISIGSSGMILGDAFPGKGFSVNSPSKVSGDTTPRMTKIKWKPVDMADASENQNHTLNKNAVRDGRLHVNGSQVITLEPGTYYFPQGIRMGGSSEIRVTGPTRLIIGGDSVVTGRGIVNATNLAANLRIDVVDGTATFTGNTSMYADIYGPTAALKIDGNAGFFGAAFGKSIELTGTASNIHGDEALRREYDETTRSKLVQ